MENADNLSSVNIKHSFQSRSGCTAAFTLVELLVAMVIIGIVVVALYAGISWGFTTVRLAREDLRATQILVEKMETIRLYNWDQITTPTFILKNFSVPYDPTAPPASPGTGLEYRGKLTVSQFTDALSYASDLRLVTLELTWTSGNMQRRREISTYVCRTGLQNYLY
jgi:prepilin-type N-terminal cleavage/methylation domain-containing protein